MAPEIEPVAARIEPVAPEIEPVAPEIELVADVPVWLAVEVGVCHWLCQCTCSSGRAGLEDSPAFFLSSRPLVGM